MKIVLATHNLHKVEELAPIFLKNNITLISLPDLKNYPKDIKETGRTFKENSALKVHAVRPYTKLPILSDDSGLEVDALNGQPGIYSARFAGTPTNHYKNVDKLLTELINVPTHQRTARFTCTLAFTWNTEIKNSIVYFEGYCPGTIARQRKGDNGFGYDPIFLPDKFNNRTMAELSLDEKNDISHRGNALKKAVTYINDHRH